MRGNGCQPALWGAGRLIRAMNSEGKNLRVAILSHGSCETLIEELSTIGSVAVVGVFVETVITPRSYSLKEQLERSIRYDGYAATAGRLFRRLFGGRAKKPAGQGPADNSSRPGLEALTARLGIPLHYVANYHSDDSIALFRAANADLGIVWGTNILKEKVFKVPRLGSINIHQGLAPYYRGGPPVFWELFNGEPEVGITVHFVESKVDTGAIVTQEKAPLAYDYSYGLDYQAFIDDFRARIASNCVRLMSQAVRMIADGSASPLPQDISLGKRYRLPVKEEKDEMKRILLRRAAEAGLDTGRIRKLKRS